MLHQDSSASKLVFIIIDNIIRDFAVVFLQLRVVSIFYVHFWLAVFVAVATLYYALAYFILFSYISFMLCCPES